MEYVLGKLNIHLAHEKRCLELATKRLKDKSVIRPEHVTMNYMKSKEHSEAAIPQIEKAMEILNKFR